MDGFTSFLGSHGSSPYNTKPDVLVVDDVHAQDDDARYMRHPGGQNGSYNSQYRPTRARPPPLETQDIGNYSRLSRSQLTDNGEFSWQDTTMASSPMNSNSKKKGVSFANEESMHQTIPSSHEGMTGHSSPYFQQNSTAGATPHPRKQMETADQVFLSPGWRGGNPGEEEYQPTKEENEILQSLPYDEIEDEKLRRVVAYQRQQINQLLTRLEQAERQLFTYRERYARSESSPTMGDVEFLRRKLNAQQDEIAQLKRERAGLIRRLAQPVERNQDSEMIRSNDHQLETEIESVSKMDNPPVLSSIGSPPTAYDQSVSSSQRENVEMNYDFGESDEDDVDPLLAFGPLSSPDKKNKRNDSETGGTDRDSGTKRQTSSPRKRRSREDGSDSGVTASTGNHTEVDKTSPADRKTVGTTSGLHRNWASQPRRRRGPPSREEAVSASRGNVQRGNVPSFNRHKYSAGIQGTKPGMGVQSRRETRNAEPSHLGRHHLPSRTKTSAPFSGPTTKFTQKPAFGKAPAPFTGPTSKFTQKLEPKGQQQKQIPRKAEKILGTSDAIGPTQKSEEDSLMPPPRSRAEYEALTRDDMRYIAPSERPFLKFLREGFVVKKVCNWGWNKKRLVWADFDGDIHNPQIRWNEAKDGIDSEKDHYRSRCLEMKSIDSFGTGQTASEKLQKHGSTSKTDLYVSLVGKDAETGKSKSLDLEFESKEERSWAFKNIQRMFTELANAYREKVPPEQIIQRLEQKVDNVKD